MDNINGYDTKERWMSYFYQIKEVISAGDEIVEIGIGNKVVSDYLKRAGKKVIMVDIDKEKKPDVCADVSKLPFKPKSCDVILCAEVLEHLPYDKFVGCLMDFKKIARKKVIISVPHFGPYFRLSIRLPFFGEWTGIVRMPFPKKHIKNEHFWEIGKRGYPVRRIVGDIKKSGLSLDRTFIVKENPYHRFFILSV